MKTQYFYKSLLTGKRREITGAQTNGSGVIPERSRKNSNEELREYLDKVRPRPMSASHEFFLQRAVRVKGSIIRLNEDVVPNIPISKEQIGSELSVFVDWMGNGGDAIYLHGLKEHGRALYFNLRFSDKYGNFYNAVQVKGAGMPEKSKKGMKYRDPMEASEDGVGAWGLEEYVGAASSWDASNMLLSKGIGTSVPLAMIKLESMVVGGAEKRGRAEEEQDAPEDDILQGRGQVEVYAGDLPDGLPRSDEDSRCGQGRPGGVR